MSKPTLVVVEDNTKAIRKIIDSFKRDAVLVGIPEGDASRTDGGISNAALLFINNFGSPLNNIPPRPVMEIGIRRAQERVAEEYRKAMGNIWRRGLSALDLAHERVGFIASQEIKNVINQQIEIEPPAESTIRSRKAQGFSGTKSLIVTAQLRNAITYVVNKGGL